jgi:hypothetical protein
MNPFKRKKEKFPTSSAPRQIEEINKEYSELIAKAGQTQYLVTVYSNELKDLNAKLLKVNQEAAARNALEKQAKAEEVKNEQL